MPRYNIEHNEKWACFTSISDGFVTEFTDKTSYENWRKTQYNKMTMLEAVSSIRFNRTHDEALECLSECGLSEAECEKLLYDIETDEYVPIPKDNGKWECPNCHKEIDSIDIRSCDGDDCCLEFVWRS